MIAFDSTRHTGSSKTVSLTGGTVAQARIDRTPGHRPDVTSTRPREARGAGPDSAPLRQAHFVSRIGIRRLKPQIECRHQLSLGLPRLRRAEWLKPSPLGGHYLRNPIFGGKIRRLRGALVRRWAKVKRVQTAPGSRRASFCSTHLTQNCTSWVAFCTYTFFLM